MTSLVILSAWLPDKGQHNTGLVVNFEPTMYGVDTVADCNLKTRSLTHQASP